MKEEGSTGRNMRATNPTNEKHYYVVKPLNVSKGFVKTKEICHYSIIQRALEWFRFLLVTGCTLQQM